MNTTHPTCYTCHKRPVRKSGFNGLTWYCETCLIHLDASGMETDPDKNLNDGEDSYGMPDFNFDRTR